ncbi:hypothetical protein [Mucilaginibacter sp. SP1R1]|uniref:hypothetical protein n=1 Tax=Mucilaginibacter sp. SP1R1 TaxID=2723091 RepID=UPI001620D00C|nr:hypothetical protein [Mucilaginibacter sp. SP1R1]MBB6147852.1 hypothetical protein [Mucilaginibacter sp. SP1R1]
MKIKAYIESGVLETFVLGSASDQEVQELLYMKAKHPEVNEALQQLEQDMEKLAGNIAMTPPPHLWNRIEEEINALIPRPEVTPARYTERNYESDTRTNGKDDQYIEVEGSSTHIRVHKSWRWVLAAIFVLGKIFLAFAIYFYLENRQAQEQLKELKTELKQHVK